MLSLLHNHFCKFPWPTRLSWFFEVSQDGDTKAMILSSKGRVVHGLFQAWDSRGSEIRALHKVQWNRLNSAPQGFPPGVTVERIATPGQFSEWVGVSNKINANRFVDYELMAKNGDVVVYARRATTTPAALDIERELSLVELSDPDLWTVGAGLERISFSDPG